MRFFLLLLLPLFSFLVCQLTIPPLDGSLYAEEALCIIGMPESATKSVAIRLVPAQGDFATCITNQALHDRVTSVQLANRKTRGKPEEG